MALNPKRWWQFWASCQREETTAYDPTKTHLPFLDINYAAAPSCPHIANKQTYGSSLCHHLGKDPIFAVPTVDHQKPTLKKTKEILSWAAFLNHKKKEALISVSLLERKLNSLLHHCQIKLKPNYW